MAAWMLERPDMQQVWPLNVVVGGINDGGLNDIRARPVTARPRRALETCCMLPAGEGSVERAPAPWRSAGRAVSAPPRAGCPHRWADGRWACWCRPISRRAAGGGAPSARARPLRTPERSGANTDRPRGLPADDRGDGSIIIVIATDAPLLTATGRAASRAMMGPGRTGSSASNGSGDYVLAFSIADSSVRPSMPRSWTPRNWPTSR